MCILDDMHVMSSPSRQKSWQTGRERVSVLAALAIQKETVSRVLAELREQHKPPGSDKPLSQEKAAARVGITGRQWQRWESGESEPYVRNLKAVSDAFSIPLSDFFDSDEAIVATTPLLSLDEVRNEFREDVDGVHSQLDRIEDELKAAHDDRKAIEKLVANQNELLARQTKLITNMEQLIEQLAPEAVTNLLAQAWRETASRNPPDDG